MIALIFIILGIYEISVHWGETWGAIALVAAVIGVIWIGVSGMHDQDRAYWNRVDYWKRDGAERARLRKQWNEGARRREEEERRRRAYNAQRSYKSAGQERMEAEEARRKREAYVAEVRARKAAGVGSDTTMGRMFQTNNPVQRMELFICPKCGREVRTVSKKMWYGDKVVREYVCPRCRMSIRTGI